MNALVEKKIGKILELLNIEYSAVECDSKLSDTQVFCEHYGYSMKNSANVIIVASKKGEEKYAACVVLANTRLDVNKAVRKKLKVSRISFATPEKTLELTGMELGGVTPFGMPDNVPVWIDSKVMDCESIILGGGNRCSKLIMSPDMLMKIPNVEVVDNLATPSK